MKNNELKVYRTSYGWDVDAAKHKAKFVSHYAVGRVRTILNGEEHNRCLVHETTAKDDIPALVFKVLCGILCGEHHLYTSFHGEKVYRRDIADVRFSNVIKRFGFLELVSVVLSSSLIPETALGRSKAILQSPNFIYSYAPIPGKFLGTPPEKTTNSGILFTGDEQEIKHVSAEADVHQPLLEELVHQHFGLVRGLYKYPVVEDGGMSVGSVVELESSSWKERLVLAEKQREALSLIADTFWSPKVLLGDGFVSSPR